MDSKIIRKFPQFAIEIAAVLVLSLDEDGTKLY
jgi:hypothetical protein